MTDITDRHAATVEAVGLANGEAPKALEQQQPPAPAPDNAQANAEAPNGDEHQDESAASDDNGTDASGKPRRNRLQERIDQITREKYEATARAEAAEQRALQYERMQQQAASPNKPTLESCGYDQDAYESALVTWAQKRGELAHQQRIEQEQVQRAQQERQAKIVEKAKAAEQEAPGMFEKATTAPINYTPHMVDAMDETELGRVKIGAYLADHLDEAHSITRMSPVQQALAIARIEAKLTATAAPTPTPTPRPVPRTVTNAPPPPPPLQAASKVETPLGEQSIEDRVAAIRAHEARQ